MGIHMQTLEIDGKEDMKNNCTKSETSEQVEYTKVFGRIMMKELGKLFP